MLANLNYAGLRKWTKRLFLFACIVLVVVLGAYILNFSPIFSVSDDPQAWGHFGDYVGGITNPILAFLSFAALLLTILLQARQLELSSKQLEHSAKALEQSLDGLNKSAQAQERSQRELAHQAAAVTSSARLASINLLLSTYREELSQMRRKSYVASDSAAIERMAYLDRRESELVDTLEALYAQLFPATQ
jgi:hypothetical protein